MLWNLNHVNIVKYYFSNISQENENSIDIVFEYVSGGSLRQLLDKFQTFDEKLVRLYTH